MLSNISEYVFSSYIDYFRFLWCYIMKKAKKKSLHEAIRNRWEGYNLGLKQTETACIGVKRKKLNILNSPISYFNCHTWNQLINILTSKQITYEKLLTNVIYWKANTVVRDRAEHILKQKLVYFVSVWLSCMNNQSNTAYIVEINIHQFSSTTRNNAAKANTAPNLHCEPLGYQKSFILTCSFCLNAGFYLTIYSI